MDILLLYNVLILDLGPVPLADKGSVSLKMTLSGKGTQSDSITYFAHWIVITLFAIWSDRLTIVSNY